MDLREKFMRAAVKEAVKAKLIDEVPVGAVVVKDGIIIARAHNRRITSTDATAHAEILALRRAGKRLGVWNLSGCELYVTLEPCAMCAGAIVQARIAKVVFGAYDKRFGACGSVINLADRAEFNHRAVIEGGVLAEECADLLTVFFKAKR